MTCFFSFDEFFEIIQQVIQVRNKYLSIALLGRLASGREVDRKELCISGKCRFLCITAHTKHRTTLCICNLGFTLSGKRLRKTYSKSCAETTYISTLHTFRYFVYCHKLLRVLPRYLYNVRVCTLFVSPANDM